MTCVGGGRVFVGVWFIARIDELDALPSYSVLFPFQKKSARLRNLKIDFFRTVPALSCAPL